jgi:hypothetical protein
MARWMAFEQADGTGILVDMDQVDAVTPDVDMMRLWFGCPKDDPTPSQDIYGSVLVRGDIEKLALMLGVETFAG